MTKIESKLNNIKYICIQPYTPYIVCMVLVVITCCMYTCRFNIPGAIAPFSFFRPVTVTFISLLIIIIYRFAKFKLFPETKNAWYILCIAFLLNLALNAELHDSFWILFPATTSTIALIYLSFLISKLIGYIVWLCIILTTYIQAVLIHCMGLTLNTQLLTQILAASADEIQNFLSPENILLLLLGVLSASVSSFFIYKSLKPIRKTTLFAQGIFHLVLIIFFLYFSSANIYNDKANVMWPLSELRSVLTNSISANEANTNLLNMVYKLPSSSKDTRTSFHIDSSSDLVCILHIGESVRADRLSINGYKNETSPNLNNLQQGGTLINFSECISSNWLTLSAIINILTDSEVFNYLDFQKNNPTCGSVTSALAAHFFRCFYLIEEGSVQDVKKDSTFFSMMYGLSKNHSEYIRTKLPSANQISKISEIVNCSAKRNTFILLNNAGSHMPFHMYNMKKPPFTPTDASAFYRNPKRDTTDRCLANNAYDNTIHYTDDYIHRIIQLLQGKPYVYIYIGDHGEYLGHDGHWGRGAFVNINDYHQTSGCRVPFFIIYSQEFISLHPHFEQAIRNLKNNQTCTTSHSNIFHTLLGLFGIQSPHYQQEKDLTHQIN